MLEILAFVDMKILIFINYGTAADTYFKWCVVSGNEYLFVSLVPGRKGNKL